LLFKESISTCAVDSIEPHSFALNERRGATTNLAGIIEGLKKNDQKNTANEINFFKRLANKVFSLRFSITNSYLFNLAICDSLMLMLIPLIIITAALKRWVFGYFTCKLFFSLEYFCKFNTAFTIVILSYDRWLAVKFPLSINKYRKTCLTRLFISVAWGLSAVLIIPVVIYSTESSNAILFNHSIPLNEMVYSCYLDWPDTWNITFLDERNFTPLSAFQFYVFAFNFLLPIIIITFFYIQVIVYMKKKNSNLTKSKNRLKSYKKVTKMVLAVIGCYIICKCNKITRFWMLNQIEDFEC
jgi:hypothetical protein